MLATKVDDAVRATWYRPSDILLPAVL